jgi:hypothetical protein
MTLVNASFRNRQLPYNNPLANLLVIIVGVATIAVSFVIGFFALFAFAAAVVVLGSIIAIRLWWFKRKLAKSGAGQPTGEAAERSPGQGPAVIEGEYQVLQGQKDGSEPPQA